MYNSIYPMNINYKNHRNNINGSINNASNSNKIVNQEKNENQNNQNLNEKKDSFQYTKGQINISQILGDFKNTIIAISPPQETQEEISIYLNLVEKESKKENPSREIILSNLKNASKISDAYIASSLNKPSRVVEGWIDTMFLQKINLKSNPEEINPEFLLDFPKKAQNKIKNAKLQETTPEVVSEEIEQPQKEVEQDQLQSSEIKINPIETQQPLQTSQIQENIKVTNELELSQNNSSETPIQNDEQDLTQPPIVKGLFTPQNAKDLKARELFIEAKNMPQDNTGDTNAINLLNEALGILSDDNSTNQNIKAAIHLERGKIFDNYDYVDYALRDYFEATKTQDLNLKAQAYYKSGNIYDEFREYKPALDNYFLSVSYSGEADNQTAQAKVLSKIASLYTKQYDLEKTNNYSDLAIETAYNSNNNKVIADTYSTSAQNYQYLGENQKALDSYKSALSKFFETDESFEQMAYNYEQASIVMRKLGNFAKADKLQSKANLYYQKAQLLDEQQAKVS